MMNMKHLNNTTTKPLNQNKMNHRQIELYNPDQNLYYWQISFLQFSYVPLTNEEYHEVHKALEDKMQEIELRRTHVDSNNQHNK